MDKKVPTKKRLIKAGIKLFSQYGYAATSTRMLAAEAKVNVSAIAFHYTNKECLYVACLDYVLAKIKAYYEESYSKIEQTFADNAMTPEKARGFLENLIALQIEVAFGEQYRTTLKLIYWESNETADIPMHPLSSAVFERLESIMAELLQCVANVSRERALLAGRQINGSIIAFGEHKSLVEHILPAPEPGESVAYWVKEEIMGNCLAIVERLERRESLPPRLSL